MLSTDQPTNQHTTVMTLAKYLTDKATDIRAALGVEYFTDEDKKVEVSIWNDDCSSIQTEFFDEDIEVFAGFLRKHDNFIDSNKFHISFNLDGSVTYEKKAFGLRRKIETNTAFFLDYHEHGECSWSFTESGPNYSFYCKRLAGLLILKSNKRILSMTQLGRREVAEKIIQKCNEWRNGARYAFGIERFEDAGVGYILEKDLNNELDKTLEFCFRSLGGFDDAPKGNWVSSLEAAGLITLKSCF